MAWFSMLRYNFAILPVVVRVAVPVVASVVAPVVVDAPNAVACSTVRYD